MRKLILGGLGAGLLLFATGLDYALPQTSVVQIVGVEVKRVDGEGGTRDVYMIQAQEPSGGRVRVFRNEDAIAYLKVNSADLQAEAAAFAREQPARTVALRYYGWRIRLLSVFPNAISLHPVDANYHDVSILRYTAFGSLLLLGGALGWRMRPKRQKVERSAPDPVRRSSSPTTGMSDSGQRVTGSEGWLSTDQSVGGGSDV